ncbi:MAG: hypothetical protein KTR30_35195 [Saprospiraceae bacterium]|nr:hypothetical protein [Saprospiraceae bacterium]
MSLEPHPNGQICTMVFFKFNSGVNKRWAFAQMVRARKPLSKMEGLQFYKLFGLGAGHGYSLKTKLDRYGFLGVWKDMAHAERFFEGAFFEKYKNRSVEIYTIFMEPLVSKGTWAGFSDWRPIPDRSRVNDLVCVLTRATLRPRYIFRFFGQIAKVVRDHKERKGLILTQGFSEIPFVEQATFSIWENEEVMQDFAYRSVHQEVIKTTREYGGFREEMYTRMQPVETRGSWEGTDPLKPYMMKLGQLAS